MSKPQSRQLTPAEVQAFGAELDALRARIVADLGEPDARYIRKIRSTVRYSELAGRGLLMLGLFPPAWLAGAATLGVSKIIENMELGHNVIHGQYDWMNDPEFRSATYEWDNVCPSSAWRNTHNYVHHTYTNVIGKDDDIGYGVLRIFPEQKWHPVNLAQPLYALTMAILFQWGVGIQDSKIDRVLRGELKLRDTIPDLKIYAKKARGQVLKDYVAFPLLAGPAALSVFTGNMAANLIRNLWAFAIIYCGHFTEDAEVFPESVLENETRAEWYLRQIKGSSNITGGPLFDILSGNLSHQIEHHLFPDLPGRRYAEIAVEVQALCAKYGQHYNTGRFSKQFFGVLLRIFVQSLPTKPASAKVAKQKPLPKAGQVLPAFAVIDDLAALQAKLEAKLAQRQQSRQSARKPAPQRELEALVA